MRQLYTLLLLIICFMAFSCEKDQRVLDSLDGTWQIKRVTHLEQDTTKLPTSGTISFSRCELGRGSCPGTYTFDNKEMSRMGFSVAEKGKVLNIHGQGPTYSFGYGYEVVQRSKNRLELEGIILVHRRHAGPAIESKQVKVSILMER